MNHRAVLLLIPEEHRKKKQLSAGFLTSTPEEHAFPFVSDKQWPYEVRFFIKTGITVAGTVPDFHQIPF